VRPAGLFIAFAAKLRGGKERGNMIAPIPGRRATRRSPIERTPEVIPRRAVAALASLPVCLALFAVLGVPWITGLLWLFGFLR
jgi:hypothetical protein